VIGLVAGFVAPGVAAPGDPAAGGREGAGAAGPPEVETFGSIAQLVRDRDASAKVDLAAVIRRPHAYALGSLEDLRGEITIVDGAVWLSYPPARPGAAVRVETGPSTNEAAAFLVVTHADERADWTAIDLPAGLASRDAAGRLARWARERGLGGLEGRPVPFRIDGAFTSLTLAIVDGRLVPPGPGTEEAMKKAQVIETHGRAHGTLVGFCSFAPPGSAFTHPGQPCHVHAALPDERATGHAQDFVVAPGATLWMPTSAR
jgi:acetolactate decarboxylase